MLLLVQLHHAREEREEEAFSRPLRKPSMQCRSRPEGARYGFPLAARSQSVHDARQDPPVVSPRPPAFRSSWPMRDQRLRNRPYFIWDVFKALPHQPIKSQLDSHRQFWDRLLDAKAVANVSQNQHRLLAALQKHPQRYTGILLDGHYCLRSTRGDITPIDSAVFRQFEPLALVLVEAEPDVIRQRLQNRDGWAPDASVIDQMVSIERSHADAVAYLLGVPLWKIASGSNDARKPPINLRSIVIEE
jgi:hypothetical protein